MLATNNVRNLGNICVSKPQVIWHAVQQRVPMRSECQQQVHQKARSRQHKWAVQAHNQEPVQKEDARPKAPATPPSKTSQQQPVNQPQQQQQGWSSVLAWLQERWQQLDLPQKAYTVVLGLVLLAALPKVLTLLILLLERVLIGGLLALEELLLELLLKGGALLGVLGAVALVGAGVYVFVRKAVK